MPLQPSSLIFLCLLLFVATHAKYNGPLWCHQGDGKDYTPGQCEESTLDCFKFKCSNVTVGFVARGCGVSLSRTASGLPNESCNQAMSVCQTLGGIGECNVCSDVHMCNWSPSPSIVFMFTLFIFRLL